MRTNIKTEIIFEEDVVVPSRGLFVALRILENTLEDGRDESLTVEHLLQRLGQREHSLLMIMVCVLLEPVPLLSSLAGPLVFTLALLQFQNKLPWIPRHLRQRQVSARTLLRVAQWGNQLERVLHRFVRPRWDFLMTAPFFRWLNLFFVLLVAVILSVPVPIPFTNLLPVLIVVLMALGQLEEDGALVLAAYALFMVSLVLFYSVGQWALKFFPGLMA